MAYQMRHFEERELACRHCGLAGCTDELKEALDDYRDLVKLPVIVNDAFRCTVHNAAVSLVAKSQHPEGTAADIRVPGMTLQEMFDAAKKISAFQYGGIGVYAPAGAPAFIHVDVRHGIARWAFVGNKEEAASVLVTG
jgi:uncharacterized protein YcbK (DUF882 family)